MLSGSYSTTSRKTVKQQNSSHLWLTFCTSEPASSTMSRHSKNNTASSVFTYYERKKIQGSAQTSTWRRLIVSLSQDLGPWRVDSAEISSASSRIAGCAWDPQSNLSAALRVMNGAATQREIVVALSMIVHFRFYLLQGMFTIEFCFAKGGKRSANVFVGITATTTGGCRQERIKSSTYGIHESCCRCFRMLNE